MIPETLRIDELLLRVPGLDEDQARWLAQDVAALLARQFGRHEMYPVPARALLHVRIPHGTPRRELAAAIAAQILEAIQ
jgi:hypothetical protein